MEQPEPNLEQLYHEDPLRSPSCSNNVTQPTPLPAPPRSSARIQLKKATRADKGALHSFAQGFATAKREASPEILPTPEKRRKVGSKNKPVQENNEDVKAFIEDLQNVRIQCQSLRIL